MIIFAVAFFALTLTMADPIAATTSIWVNPVFRSVLADTKSVQAALRASGPLSAVEFLPISPDIQIIEWFRFHEKREYQIPAEHIKRSPFGLSWTSPLGVSVNLLSDQLYPIALRDLAHVLTEGLLDGVYIARKNRALLIDKGILYWRGRNFPLVIELDPSFADTDFVRIVGEKDVFGRSVRWGTSWSAPTLNFYPINRTRPFLTLRKLPEYKLAWPHDIKIGAREHRLQRFYDRLVRLTEAEEFELLTEYVGHQNLTVIHGNWTEKFKSARVLKWRLKSTFTKKIIAVITGQKGMPEFIENHGLSLGNGDVVIQPNDDGSFQLIIRP